MEVFVYALSHGVTRPVLGQDFPLWFAALLAVGLLGAATLFVSALVSWALHMRHR